MAKFRNLIKNRLILRLLIQAALSLCAAFGFIYMARLHRDRALLDAVEARDVTAAEQALKRGANIEVRKHVPLSETDPRIFGEDGDTPLALAIDRRDDRMVRVLIAHGANVKATTVGDGDRFPPRDIILAPAAERGETATVELLLSHGARVDAKTGMNCTALMLAAQRNRLDIAKLLIAKGANVNARDDRSFTVLDFATGAHNADHTAMIKLLRDAGATR